MSNSIHSGINKNVQQLGLCLLCVSLLLQAASACTNRDPNNPKAIPQIVLPKAKPSSWEQESYYYDLLRIILKRTEAEFGPCEISQTEQMLTRMRSAALISRNQGVDLFWGASTIERERLLLAIRVPLLKGLMGNKILIIHPDNQPLFSAVTNLEQLRKLRAGQGADWPDVDILSEAGINVVTSANYEALYKMASAKRFDFFPRGANQVLSELRYNAEKSIVVEQDLVLRYPAPLYFYVEKDNKELALRIETGLRGMIKDGSYDRYFYQHPLMVDALRTLRLDKRRAITLHNSLLPPGVTEEEPEDWMAKLRQYNPGLDIPQ